MVEDKCEFKAYFPRFKLVQTWQLLTDNISLIDGLVNAPWYDVYDTVWGTQGSRFKLAVLMVI